MLVFYLKSNFMLSRNKITLFRNEYITDINYPELLTAFYHYIIYMHIKKLIIINLNEKRKSSS